MQLEYTNKLTSLEGIFYSLQFNPDNFPQCDGERGERHRTVRGTAIEESFACTPDNFRKVVGQILQDASAQKLSSIYVEVQASNPAAHLVQSIAETFTLGMYRFETEDYVNKFKISVNKVSIHVPDGADFKDAIESGFRSGTSYNFARRLGDLPANILTPYRLADEGRAFLGKSFKSRVMDFNEIHKLGFGGLIAVGKGSDNPPCVGVYDFFPSGAEKTIVLVGKGVTFDTGGYSIKGKQHHNEMKFDMCGAANVIAALEVLSRTVKNTRIVGVIGCVENMVSENAQRPGDVYKAFNGKTVEVFNTDAEGRLVLADLLSFAVSEFKPNLLVDIATLTGGTTQIAGSMAGIFCVNDENLIAKVKTASQKAGEKFLHLEILPETKEQMKGTVSDYTNMQNEWSAGAATMFAASFLNEFVPSDVPWIHLDVANMAWNVKKLGYVFGNGATGFGARTLVELARS